MKRISNYIVEKKHLILVIMFLLLIPSLIGYKLTKINYDILVYLPSDIETLKGEHILTNDFKMGSFATVITENMDAKEILKLEQDIKKIDTVNKVISLNDLTGTEIPVDMLPSNITKRLSKDNNMVILVTFTESTSDAKTLDAVEEMRNIVSKDTKIGGMSAMVLDTKELFNSEMLLYVVIAVVLCILVLELSLDSYLVPFLLMINIGIAILFNMGSNIFLGNISYITKAIAAVLQLGVTTDFSIFLYHKYEKLKDTCNSKEEAMSKAISDTFTSVIGSSLTTVAGFLALCTMKLTLGVDIGIVMAKGVIIGVICVLTIFPALLLMFDKKIENTKHKVLLPEFKGIKKFVLKHYIAIFLIFIIMLVPAYLSQKKTEVYYKLDSSIPEDYGYSKATKSLKEDYNLVSQEMIIVPNDIEDYKVNEMVKKIEKIDGIDLVINPSILTKYGIDTIISENIKKVYKTDNYKMIIVLSEYDIATDELNNQISKINEIIKTYDKRIILAGEGPLMKDLVNTTDIDFKNVNYTSIGVIFILMLFVLKSISLPILLVTAIEFAIFINMGVPYYTGTEIPFIASVVIGTIQLGATIDYAILMTTKYLEERKNNKNKKEAVQSALDNSVNSIFVSAMCFFAATIGVGIVSKIDMIGSLCRLISRGAIISMIVVICIVPSILLIFDKLIIKTTILKKGNDNMKNIKKVIATSLILSIVLSPINTLALTKEETVYSKLDSNGKVIETSVNTHLINDEKKDIITELTDLENLINTSSSDKLSLNDNILTVESKGKDVFFTGTTSKQLPISTAITYKLDGEDISIDDLIGKSGKVEINIKYTNNLKNIVNINGKLETLYTPLLVATLTRFNSISNSNLNVENAKVIDNGTSYMIIGLSTPGLYESLNLNELKDLDKVTITLETTKFELPSIYTVTTSKIIDSNDIDVFNKFNGLSKKVNTLQESMNQIEDGSKSLKEGSSKLKAGLEQAMTKLSNNNQSLSQEQLAKINEKVEASISEIVINYLTQANLLDTYINCKTNGNLSSCAVIANDPTMQIISAVSKKSAEASAKEVSNIVKTEILTQVGSNLNTLYEGVSALDNGIETLETGISAFNEQGIKQISGLANTLGEKAERVEALINLSNEYQSFSIKDKNTKSNTKLISVIEGKSVKEEIKKETKTKAKKNIFQKFIDLFR